MIYVSMTLNVSRKDLQEVLGLLRPAVGMTSTEPGNRSCRLWTEVDAPGNVLLHEEWESPTDLERHFRSPVYRRILAVMEMSTAPPDVRFVLSEDVRGIDWIERARLDGTGAPGS